MARKLTAEHKKALLEGQQRAAAERRSRRPKEVEQARRHIRDEANAYRTMLGARATFGRNTPEYDSAYKRWQNALAAWPRDGEWPTDWNMA